MSGARADPIMQLGASGIRVAPLGLGAMSWANRSPMGYGGADSPAAEARALEVSLAAGVTLVDTAEAYGRGRSERRVGELIRGHAEIVVATKYAPYPFRRAEALPRALQHSLARLGRIDLYQIHWKPRFVAVPSPLRLVAMAHHEGQIRAIGVSNFTAGELRAAHTALADHGIPLAANQVQYSLVHRDPETNGVLETCRELGVALIAYSPLGMGVLTGNTARAGAPAASAGSSRTSGHADWPCSSHYSRCSERSPTIMEPPRPKSRSGGSSSTARCPSPAPRTRSRPPPTRARCGYRSTLPRPKRSRPGDPNEISVSPRRFGEWDASSPSRGRRAAGGFAVPRHRSRSDERAGEPGEDRQVGKAGSLGSRACRGSHDDVVWASSS